MKIKLIPILLIFITLNSFGQISFEKGYFIDSNNQRVDCLIKNTDWKNNPAEFEYKLTSDGIAEKGNLRNVKEYGVTGFSRYVRADVKVDVSPTGLNNLSKERNPVWSQERLFLKVLVEGKAKLYYYEKGKIQRFFYSVSDTAINQLIYKQYYADENQVAENVKFREQLWIDVRCANANINSVENLRFNKTELERYFKKHNEGKGNPTVVYSDMKKRDSYHLKITPGLNYSWASLSDISYPNIYSDLGSQIGFRVGIEAEYIFPFNRNKWCIIFDPSYQYFNSSGQYESYTIDVNYQSIEFPIGLRHYFFLNENLKIFLNAVYIPAFSIDFNSTILNHETRTGSSYALGGGIGFKKLSGEIRYSTSRNLLKNYSNYTDYRRFSFILGYRIL